MSPEESRATAEGLFRVPAPTVRPRFPLLSNSSTAAGDIVSVAQTFEFESTATPFMPPNDFFTAA